MIRFWKLFIVEVSHPFSKKNTNEATEWSHGWLGARVELDGENDGQIKSWKQLKFTKRSLKQSLSNQSIPSNRTFKSYLPQPLWHRRRDYTMFTYLSHFSAWNHRVAFLFQKKMIQNLGSWSLGIIHNYLHTWEVIQNKDYISMRCSPSFLQLSNIAKHLQWTLLSEPNFAQKSSGGVFGSGQKETQWMVF